MKTRLTLIALAVGFGLGMSGAMAQESAVGTESFGPIPAPPGPYRSSRPYLGGEQGMPYHGAMQFPFAGHARPYFGPGRYWAPSEQEQRDPRERLATRPMPPWGPPRVVGDEAAASRNESAASPAQAWPHRPPTWWQPPARR